MNHAIVGTGVEPQSSTGLAQLSVDQQMSAFLEKLDSNVEKSRQMLAAAEASLVEKKALCAAFPSTLPMAPSIIDITPGGYKADAELCFEVTTREEVLQLLDAFPGVPAVMLRAGCTSFVAEERFTEADPGTEVVPIGEVVYRLSNWTEGPQEEYTWWTHVSGTLVHVVAKTKKGHFACAKVTSTNRMLSPGFYEVTYNYSNLPDGVILTWYGGNMRSMVPVTVHQPPGGSFHDAVAKPKATTAKVSARHCDC